jgi:peroxisomal membrane protein 4
MTAAQQPLQLLALRVLFGARNGALYGLKVRAPHSLVLTSLCTCLFLHSPGSCAQSGLTPGCGIFATAGHEGDAKTKARVIASATATHAKQLALFAALYKSTFYALGLAAGSRVTDIACGSQGVGPVKSHTVLRAAAAGALAGGFVFRQNTPINVQVVLFLFSRTVLAAVKKASGRAPAALKAWGWPLFASATWGAVMSMWELDKHVLAPGLLASMDFIYEDDDKRRTWSELCSPSAWRAALAHR